MATRTQKPPLDSHALDSFLQSTLQLHHRHHIHPSSPHHSPSFGLAESALAPEDHPHPPHHPPRTRISSPVSISSSITRPSTETDTPRSSTSMIPSPRIMSASSPPTSPLRSSFIPPHHQGPLRLPLSPSTFEDPSTQYQVNPSKPTRAGTRVRSFTHSYTLPTQSSQQQQQHYRRTIKTSLGALAGSYTTLSTTPHNTPPDHHPHLNHLHHPSRLVLHLLENQLDLTTDSSLIPIHVRYVPKDLWIQIDLPRNLPVHKARDLILSKCRLTCMPLETTSVFSLPTSSSSSALSTHSNAPSAITNEQTPVRPPSPIISSPLSVEYPGDVSIAPAEEINPLGVVGPSDPQHKQRQNDQGGGGISGANQIGREVGNVPLVLTSATPTTNNTTEGLDHDDMLLMPIASTYTGSTLEIVSEYEDQEESEPEDGESNNQDDQDDDDQDSLDDGEAERRAEALIMEGDHPYENDAQEGYESINISKGKDPPAGVPEQNGQEIEVCHPVLVSRTSSLQGKIGYPLTASGQRHRQGYSNRSAVLSQQQHQRLLTYATMHKDGHSDTHHHRHRREHSLGQQPSCGIRGSTAGSCHGSSGCSAASAAPMNTNRFSHISGWTHLRNRQKSSHSGKHVGREVLDHGGKLADSFSDEPHQWPQTTASEQQASQCDAWKTCFGLFWVAAGHWLDDSRLINSYNIQPNDLFELQLRNHYIQLPPPGGQLGYYDHYAEGMLYKLSKKGRVSAGVSNMLNSSPPGKDSANLSSAPVMTGIWKERWVVLQGRRLLIYHKRKDTTKKTIDLALPLVISAIEVPPSINIAQLSNNSSSSGQGNNNNSRHSFKMSSGSGNAALTPTMIQLTISPDPTIPKVCFRATSESEINHWVRIFHSLNDNSAPLALHSLQRQTTSHSPELLSTSSFTALLPSLPSAFSSSLPPPLPSPTVSPSIQSNNSLFQRRHNHDSNLQNQFRPMSPSSVVMDDSPPPASPTGRRSTFLNSNVTMLANGLGRYFSERRRNHTAAAVFSYSYPSPVQDGRAQVLQSSSTPLPQSPSTSLALHEHMQYGINPVLISNAAAALLNLSRGSSSPVVLNSANNNSLQKDISGHGVSLKAPDLQLQRHYRQHSLLNNLGKRATHTGIGDNVRQRSMTEPNRFRFSSPLQQSTSFQRSESARLENARESLRSPPGSDVIKNAPAVSIEASDPSSTSSKPYSGHIWLYIPNKTGSFPGLSSLAASSVVTTTSCTTESGNCSPVSSSASSRSATVLSQAPALPSCARVGNICRTKASGRYVKCFATIDEQGLLKWAEVKSPEATCNSERVVPGAGITAASYGIRLASGPAANPPPPSNFIQPALSPAENTLPNQGRNVRQSNVKNGSDSVKPCSEPATPGSVVFSVPLATTTNTTTAARVVQASMAHKLRLYFFCIKISPTSLAEVMTEMVEKTPTVTDAETPTSVPPPSSSTASVTPWQSALTPLTQVDVDAVNKEGIPVLPELPSATFARTTARMRHHSASPLISRTFVMPPSVPKERKFRTLSGTLPGTRLGSSFMDGSGPTWPSMSPLHKRVLSRDQNHGQIRVPDQVPLNQLQEQNPSKYEGDLKAVDYKMERVMSAPPGSVAHMGRRSFSSSGLQPMRVIDAAPPGLVRVLSDPAKLSTFTKADGDKFNVSVTSVTPKTPTTETTGKTLSTDSCSLATHGQLVMASPSTSSHVVSLAQGLQKAIRSRQVSVSSILESDTPSPMLVPSVLLSPPMSPSSSSNGTHDLTSRFIGADLGTDSLPKQSKGRRMSLSETVTARKVSLQADFACAMMANAAMSLKSLGELKEENEKADMSELVESHDTTQKQETKGCGALESFCPFLEECKEAEDDLEDEGPGQEHGEDSHRLKKARQSNSRRRSFVILKGYTETEEGWKVLQAALERFIVGPVKDQRLALPPIDTLIPSYHSPPIPEIRISEKAQQFFNSKAALLDNNKGTPSIERHRSLSCTNSSQESTSNGITSLIGRSASPLQGSHSLAQTRHQGTTDRYSRYTIGAMTTTLTKASNVGVSRHMHRSSSTGSSALLARPQQPQQLTRVESASGTIEYGLGHRNPRDSVSEQKWQPRSQQMMTTYPPTTAWNTKCVAQTLPLPPLLPPPSIPLPSVPSQGPSQQRSRYSSGSGFQNTLSGKMESDKSNILSLVPKMAPPDRKDKTKAVFRSPPPAPLPSRQPTVLLFDPVRQKNEVDKVGESNANNLSEYMKTAKRNDADHEAQDEHHHRQESGHGAECHGQVERDVHLYEVFDEAFEDRVYDTKDPRFENMVYYVNGSHNQQQQHHHHHVRHHTFPTVVDKTLRQRSWSRIRCRTMDNGCGDGDVDDLKIQGMLPWIPDEVFYPHVQCRAFLGREENEEGEDDEGVDGEIEVDTENGVLRGLKKKKKKRGQDQRTRMMGVGRAAVTGVLGRFRKLAL